MFFCTRNLIINEISVSSSWYQGLEFPSSRHLPFVLLIVQVERSVALLKSLASEKERWETGSEAFNQQMATIIGDVLLMSAFMAYSGNYNTTSESSQNVNRH